jgi:hypothetical protein
MSAEYQGEDDHRTLTRAAEIHGDKKRMAGVAKHHAKQTKALHTVGSMLHGRSMMKGHR